MGYLTSEHPYMPSALPLLCSLPPQLCHSAQIGNHTSGLPTIFLFPVSAFVVKTSLFNSISTLPAVLLVTRASDEMLAVLFGPLACQSLQPVVPHRHPRPGSAHSTISWEKCTMILWTSGLKWHAEVTQASHIFLTMSLRCPAHHCSSIMNPNPSAFPTWAVFPTWSPFPEVMASGGNSE